MNLCAVCGDPVDLPYSRHARCLPADMWVRCDTCGTDLAGLVALLVHLDHRANQRSGTACDRARARAAATPGRVVDLGPQRRRRRA